MIKILIYCMIVIVFYFITTLVWIGLENLIQGKVTPNLAHDIIAFVASLILGYFAYRRI